MSFDLSVLGPNMRLQMVQLACGQFLGEGQGRKVFECNLNPLYVVKVENTSGSFQNICEWELWRSLRESTHAKWLAPCERISTDGGFLIQRRTVPMDDRRRPKKLPVWMADFKPENFGVLDGRVVCHDYGTVHIALTERGLSHKLQPVKWRGVANG